MNTTEHQNDPLLLKKVSLSPCYTPGLQHCSFFCFFWRGIIHLISCGPHWFSSPGAITFTNAHPTTDRSFILRSKEGDMSRVKWRKRASAYLFWALAGCEGEKKKNQRWVPSRRVIAGLEERKKCRELNCTSVGRRGARILIRSSGEGGSSKKMRCNWGEKMVIHYKNLSMCLKNDAWSSWGIGNEKGKITHGGQLFCGTDAVNSSAMCRARNPTGRRLGSIQACSALNFVSLAYVLP